MEQKIERTINCDINEIRLKGIEGTLEKVVDKIEYINQSNEVNSELMTKFDTMMNFIIEDRKEQREINKEQREINKKTSETLEKINDNLTGLNKDVGNLEKKVINIEITQEKQKNRGNINIVDLFTENFNKVLGLIITGGILYALGKIVPKIVENM